MDNFKIPFGLSLLLTFLLSFSNCVPSVPRRYGPGYYYFDLDGRIVNGSLAKVENTKHQVSIRKKLNDGYFFGTGHICGGSLIRHDVVLSAAHCFVSDVDDKSFLPKEDYITVMGNLDRYVKNENTLIFELRELIFALPHFNKATYNKDIALLFLKGSVPPNHPTVQPIVLADKEFPPSTICQVTGWGVTEDGYITDELRTLDVPLIDSEDCRTKTDFQPTWIKDGMLCAGYLEGQKDACAGDSGGPLVCQKVLSGIVSWGIGCALPKLPGVYTDVAHWHTWIEFQIAAIDDGDIGSGDEGSGDIGSGDIGSGDIGSGDIGSGDIGSGDTGNGEGSGDLGSGEGSGDIGSGEGSGEGSGDDGGAAASIQSSFYLTSLLLLVALLSRNL